MERTRLYLIRHGQVEGYREKRYNGQVNVALTAHGKAQLQSLSEQLVRHPLAAVYCSDLDRCVFGAELLAGSRGLIAEQRPGLRELDVGDWEGHTWQELMTSFPDEWQERLKDFVNYRVPGGESFLDAAQRVRAIMFDLRERHRGQEIVLVGHGGVNRIILLDAIGAALENAFNIEQDYGCLNVIDYFADGNAVVRLLNSDRLPESLCAP